MEEETQPHEVHLGSSDLTASPTQPMDLHAAIMNLRFPAGWDFDFTEPMRMAYRWGHRDARHAGAELASEFSASKEAEIARLRDALTEIIGEEPMSPEGGHETVAEIHRIARAALENK